MIKEPETYAELIRKKRCIDLTKYYNLTEEQLDLIYDFLTKNPNGIVRANASAISLLLNNAITMTIATPLISSAIDGLTCSNNVFTIIPHYTPGSGGGYSSGGSSSNNNNNNNNNNNR